MRPLALTEPAILLRAGAAVEAGSASPSPKLVRAAHEFEAQMMKELLKPMTGDNALVGDDDGSGLELGSGSGSEGALADFASESLGQALSQRGGFGIADRIVKELGHTQGKSVSGRSATGIGVGRVTDKVTAAPHRNTVMRTLK